jgi:hypothetical protein
MNNLTKRVERMERAVPETASEVALTPAIAALLARLKGVESDPVPRPEVAYEDLSPSERASVDEQGLSPTIARLIEVATGRAEWPNQTP